MGSGYGQQTTSGCSCCKLDAGQAALDFTVTSPLVSNSLSETSVTAWSAAFAAEERKHRSNDTKCAELGWVSIPLAVETYSWGYSS